MESNFLFLLKDINSFRWPDCI